MKFLCGNCKAKYQIADEKASGRTLRMKCRRCGHDILIDGHNMGGSSPPSVHAGARRPGAISVVPGAPRHGSGAHALPPSAPRPPGGGAPRTAGRGSRPPSALNAEFRRHAAAPPEVPQRTAPYDLWHVAIQDVPVGPMTRDELTRKVETGAVTGESLCWREGMDDWRPLRELPELAQVLRRGRGEGSWSGRPPPRPRTPPAPASGRASPTEPELLQEVEDEPSAPTRIADMPQLAKVLTASPAGHATLSGTTLSGSEGSPAAALPERAPRGTSGLTTGIAVGLLLGILFVGGPILFRNTWGSPPSAAVVTSSQPESERAPVQPKVAPEDIELNVEEEPLPEEEGDQAKVSTKSRAAPARVRKPAASGGAKDNLSESERRLLERMGGGGNVPLADVQRDRSGGGGGHAGGPSLTASQLSSVVQKNKVQLQRCYESALRATGGRQEGTVKVTVSVTVGSSGTTKEVSTQGAGIGNMTTCIRQSVKRWRFPASGGESEFTFPLVFQPGA